MGIFQTVLPLLNFWGLLSLMNEVLSMKFGSGSFLIDKDSFCKYLAVLIHGSIYNASMDESFNDLKVDFGLKIHQFRWINQSIRLPGMGLEAEPSEDMKLDPTQGKWVWGVFL